MKNRAWRVVVLILLVGVLGVGVLFVARSLFPGPEGTVVIRPPDVPMDSLQVGQYTIQFYMDLQAFASIGFLEEDRTGPPRHFPLKGSVSRNLLLANKVDVFVSDDDEEMWVVLSGPEREEWFYHQLGSKVCLFDGGVIDACDTPAPKSFQATRRKSDIERPVMDDAWVTRRLSFQIGEVP